ncbi:hypothetical protein D3C76_1209420 [compost metagenome]
MAVAPALQVLGRDHAAEQKQARQHDQARMAQRRDQQRAQNRAAQPAQARTRRQQAEQALALLAGEQVGQHAPGQRDGQQVEHRQPDIEGPRLPYVVRLTGEQHREQQQIADKEPVGPVQDMPPPHLRGQPAEQRQARQGGDEGAGEQPLQVVDTPGHTHGLAHRAQHEVAGEQQVEQRKPRDNGRPLARPDVQSLLQLFAPAGHGLSRTAGSAPVAAPG